MATEEILVELKGLGLDPHCNPLNDAAELAVLVEAVKKDYIRV